MKPGNDQVSDHRVRDEVAATDQPVGTLPDVTALVLKHKWLILAGLSGGLIVGHLAYLKLGPTYRAATRVLVSKRSSVPLKEDSAAKTYGERGEHVALIMSPMIVGDAVKLGRLNELPSLRGCDDPVQEILDTLRVKRTAGTDHSFVNVLDISCESRALNEASAIVKAVVQSYQNYLATTQQENSKKTLALITEANADLHRQLQEKEQAYIKFRDSAPLQWHSAPGADGQPGDTTDVHQERLRAIEAERRANLLKRTDLNSKLKAIAQAQASGDSKEALELLVRRFLNLDGQAAQAAVAAASGTAERGDAGLRTAMEMRLLPLLLEERKLLRDFGTDHPDVKTVRKSIQTTREFFERQGVAAPDLDAGRASEDDSRPAVPPAAKLVDLIAVYIDSLKQELVELGFRDQQLAELFEVESREAKAVSRFQLEDQTLNEEIKRIKSLWELVVNRLNEMNIGKDAGGYNLKVVAEPREELVFKRRLKITGAGGAFGFILAFGLLYLRAWLDTTLKSVEEVQRNFGLPVIGRVPAMHSRPEAKISGSGLDPSLYLFHDAGSPEAEAFRSVRSALFVHTHSRGERVIQITSPEPQDGKSTIVSNLALAMAQAGKRVLLIDADMRCPKIHKLFGLRQEIGLADVLTGEITLSPAVQTTEATGLFVLSSGMTPANPAELLGSPRFSQLLVDARGDFDFVLVDTPPLLAVSDPCVVTSQVEGLLLVLRLGKNRRAAARRAKELLTTHGVRLLGAIVNGVAPSPGYHGDYNYRAYNKSVYEKLSARQRVAADT